MIRGTTAAFKFKFPHQLQYIAEAKVVFWQEGYEGTLGSSLPIVKRYTYENNFVGNTSNELIVVLTSSETKAFSDQFKAKVQMKALSTEYVNENGQTIQSASLGTIPQSFIVYPMEDDIIDGPIDETTQATDGYIILSGGNIATAQAGD